MFASGCLEITCCSTRAKGKLMLSLKAKDNRAKAGSSELTYAVNELRY